MIPNYPPNFELYFFELEAMASANLMDGVSIPENISISEVPGADFKKREYPVRGACQHRGGKSVEPRVFCCPNSIAIDEITQNVFICDGGNDRVQVLTASFEFSHEFNDGMDTPFGICISENNVYVTQCRGDHLNVYSKQGKLLKLVGKQGDKELQFLYPTGVAVSTEKKKVYVCDMENDRIQCLNMNLTFDSFIPDIKLPQDVKLTSDRIVVLSLDEKCVRNYDYDHNLLGKMIPIGVGFPTQLCIDAKGNILLSDGMAICVSIFSPSGELLQKLGMDGLYRGKFLMPSGIALDSENRIIIVSQSPEECVQSFELKL